MASELAKYKRHLANARREIKRAVERFAEVDTLEGHNAEALRRITAVRDEAARGVELIEQGREKEA